MKGVLFTELIEMVEDLMGLEFTNQVIEDAKLENAGAYTAIGCYPSQEMYRLMESLSIHAQSSQERVLKGYGECLFHRLSLTYKQELTPHPNAFSFLLQLETLLKQEIKKLYPKAGVPSVNARLLNAQTLEIDYTSAHSMPDLLEGFLLGCIGHYNEAICLQRKDLLPAGKSVRFLLHKNSAHE